MIDTAEQAQWCIDNKIPVQFAIKPGDWTAKPFLLRHYVDDPEDGMLFWESDDTEFVDYISCRIAPNIPIAHDGKSIPSLDDHQMVRIMDRRGMEFSEPVDWLFVKSYMSWRGGVEDILQYMVIYEGES